MTKKWKWIITAAAVLLCLSACGKKSAPEPTQAPEETTASQENDTAFYCGTWKVTGIQFNGIEFTLEQVTAMGAEGMGEVRLVLTSGGLVYLQTDDDVNTAFWAAADDGIRVGNETFPYADGRLILQTDEYQLLLEKESDDEMPPKAAAPAQTAAPAEEEPAQPETTVPATEADPQPTGIRPEFKEAMDAYEAFYDEYCAFMEDYKKNPTDLSLLGKYAGMLTKVEEMDRKFKAWNENEMSSEELKYYLEVNTRVQKRILDLI